MTSHGHPGSYMVLVEAVYYQHHFVYATKFNPIADAQWFLQVGEENGRSSSVGVFVDGAPYSCMTVTDEGEYAWIRPSGVTVSNMRESYGKRECYE